MIFNLSNINSALIIGANKGIGFAIVKRLKDDHKIDQIYATYRDEKTAIELLKTEGIVPLKFNPLLEDEYVNISKRIESVDLVINCIGTLHHEQLTPEKSLKDINFDSLIEYFEVNSFITPMIAKYFKNHLRNSKNALLCSISAKVGSIEDNQIGGWYGYRASKAALNMFLKTIDIEFKRDKVDCVVRAIHPGTTTTYLSKPFIKNTKYQLHEPLNTAKNILEVLDQAESEDHLFISWDKEEIKW
jgi:NAD(P)-dependent dehydrogenase (short-subunit alcohol dehydrogenase family)